jgi:hypothetical protein
MIFLAIAGKKLNKKVKRGLAALAIFFLFLPQLLPRQIFGRWNSISKLDDKVPATIIARLES